MTSTECANRIPELYCALSIYFEKNIDIQVVTDKLETIGLHEFKIRNPKLEECIVIDMAIVNNKCAWEVDDVLTMMFSKIDSKLSALKKIIKKHRGEAYIDIAFYHYGTYPALVFCGDNMRKINFLEACISIDPL